MIRIIEGTFITCFRYGNTSLNLFLICINSVYVSFCGGKNNKLVSLTFFTSLPLKESIKSLHYKRQRAIKSDTLNTTLPFEHRLGRPLVAYKLGRYIVLLDLRAAKYQVQSHVPTIKLIQASAGHE